MALTKIPASFIDTSSGITGDTTVTGNFTVTGYLAGPSTFTIDPAGVGDNTGTVVIAGNLQVDGTTTTINSTTMEVDDLNITLASGAANAAAADGAGITIDGASATLTYNSTPDAWSFNKNVGIGTSSPSARLEIDAGSEGQSAPVEAIRIAGPNTPGNSNSSQDIKWKFDYAGSSIIRSYRASSWGTHLGFYTNSDSEGSDNPQERLHISDNGNVGIGTSSPGASLHVDGDGTWIRHTGYGQILDFGNWVSGEARVESTGADLALRAHSTYPILFYTNSAERMRIDSSGNVGLGNGAYIGTLSSTHSLSIQGGAGAPGGKITLHGGTGSNRIDFLIGTSEAMRINAGRNVGIGTDTPNSGGSASSWLTLSSKTLGGHTYSGGLSFDVNGTNQMWLYQDTDNLFAFQGAGSNDGFKFLFGGSEFVRITDSGNLLVGRSASKSMQSAAEKSIQVKGGILSGYPQGPGASFQEPRIMRDWFVYTGATNSGSTYVHMKTDLDSSTANTMYTMSHFRFHSAYNYTGSVRVASGGIGFHNWSNTLYQMATYNDTSWTLVQNGYVSSDGKVVLVAYLEGSYAGFSIDWHQWAGYPFREAKVTAVTTSSNTTGVY